MAPSLVLAHGLVQRADLPVPDWLFGWAATAVLVASFVGLAVLWPAPRLQPTGVALSSPVVLRPASIVRILRGTARLCGVLALVAVVLSGLLGAQQPQANLAPTAVLAVFWVGLALASAIAGDLFRWLSPWRTIGLALEAAWRGTGRPRRVRVLPPALGAWPAAAGILMFTWIELVSGFGDAPRNLVIYVLLYSLATWAAMATYGVDRWHDGGEAFARYFSLFARLAPVAVTDSSVRLRRPLIALAELPSRPGQPALLAVMIGTVTFDGLSQGALWQDVLRGPLVDAFSALGASTGTAGDLAGTFGLLAAVGTVAALYELGVRGVASVSASVPLAAIRSAFTHSLVPIAFAYVVAHYLTYLLFQGQAMGRLLSDPLGRGWDLFGTASAGIDFGLVGQATAWYIQVAVVLAGHVAGLVLAHDRALALFDDAREAVRSQYWMLGVMAAFTSLALWLLAQANA